MLLLSFSSLLALPEALRFWPFPLLIPLAIYAVIALMLEPLRRTAEWLRVGKMDRRLIAATVCLSVISTMALFLCHFLMAPNPTHLDEYLPLDLFGHAILTAILFSLMNPLLEEIVFRGILYQTIAAYWPWPVAVLGSSVVFGLGHMNGYPPGVAGAILAGLYGIALGILRHKSRGILLGVLAHLTGDATIAGMRLQVS